MPYYKQREALSPLASSTITPVRVERFLELIATGFSRPVSGFSLGSREQAVEDYKSFYVARSIHFTPHRESAPTYWLTLVGEKVDARVCFPGSRSPWLDEKPPALADIEHHWQPLSDPVLIDELEQTFKALESHAENNQCAELTDEERLAEIQVPDVDLRVLEAFCVSLGRESRDSLAYIEEHVIPAASNPHDYLVKNNLLCGMTLNSCRYFSWHDLVFGSSSFFRQHDYFCEMDWKAEAADVEWNINNLLTRISSSRARFLDLADDGENYLTEYWLKLAAEKLRISGWRILFLDNVGDSYIFSLVEAHEVTRFEELGRALGLETGVMEMVEPRRKGWLYRLLG